MVKLPNFFEKDNRLSLIKLDDLSFIIHRQSIGQKKIQTYLTTNLLVFILKGKKIIHTEAGDIQIDTGDAFFAQKGSYLISEKLNQDGSFQSLIFFIDDRFLKEFINKNIHLLSKTDVGNWIKPEIYKIKSTDLFKKSAESLLSYFTQNFSNKKELLKLKFEELFFHIINAEKDQHFLRFLKSIQTPEKTDLALFMNENFIYPLTIQEFAQQTSRSLTTFKIEFKRIYNQSPRRWINQQRLERAQMLLKITDKNVTEISFDVGFDNVSHFIQLFRKKFGITPKRLKSSNNK